MNTDDHEAIRAIIDRQFGSLNWSPTAPAKWSEFVGDFLPGVARTDSPLTLSMENAVCCVSNACP
jgi:hypothetical protein